MFWEISAFFAFAERTDDSSGAMGAAITFTRT
jgi:hypothetical protein